MSRNYAFILILVYLIVFMGSLISLIGHNFKTLSFTNELQNKLLETQLQIKDQELQYLKKQIHPHFLFNTLNTIYGFALKQSKDTPEIILKLSNLLDYILYQVNKPSVRLDEEVSHIKEYIDLERIRFQDSLKVSFTSDEIDSDIQIAPMLLIPFVENAFKHGSLTDDFLRIELEIKTVGKGLDFSIKNSIKSNYEEGVKKGIGLDNIKKRLDILYKDDYNLDINREENWFKVRLRIDNLKPI